MIQIKGDIKKYISELKEVLEVQNFNFLFGDDDSHYLLYNENYIKIGSLMYHLLNSENENCLNHFISKYEHDELEIINNKLKDFIYYLKSNSKQKKRSKYIKYKLILINEKSTNIITERLTFLIPKNHKIYFILFFFLCLVNFIFYYLHHTEVKTFDFPLTDIFIYYLILIIIMIFHEFGHASAAKKFNIKPKEIGFGFYIILPVFYADVSRIWLLNRKKRLIINCSGIYFQLITNILLFIFFVINPNPIFLKVIMVNTFVAFYSFIPFLRNDGYWIFSDYFEIPNLMNQSKYFTVLFIKKIILGYPINPKYDIPLFAFSLGNTLFLTLIIVMFYNSLNTRLIELYYLLSSSDSIFNLTYKSSGKVFIALVMGIAFIAMIYSLLKRMHGFIKYLQYE